MPKSSTKTPPDGSDAARFLKSMQDPDIIERVRVTIKNAHVFKLPPRQSVSVGWRGADWKEKVWQGIVKVVERGDMTAVLLVDRTKGSIFAVCPVKEGAVERCIDSSRYFVLRIENANGRHMFIGVAFNERNDAFDFNTALEDSRREREMERMPVKPYTGPTKDYSIKEGEKIHVAIPNVGSGGDPEDTPSPDKPSSNAKGALKFGGTTPVKSGAAGHGKVRKSNQAGGLLAPSSKDTPSRTEQNSPLNLPALRSSDSNSPRHASALGSFFSDASSDDPFPSTSFQDNNPFHTDDHSTQSSHPFFKQSENNKSLDPFDPRQYRTGKGM